MKGLTRVLVLSLLFTGGSNTVLPSQAKAEVECEEIEATQTVTANLSTFTTTGTIRGDLKGTTQFTGDATSLTPIAGTVSPPLNPTFPQPYLLLHRELGHHNQQGNPDDARVGFSNSSPSARARSLTESPLELGSFKERQACSTSPLRRMAISVASPASLPESCALEKANDD